MPNTISLTDEAVELALAWDRLHNVMETEKLVYAGFDGKAWLVAATRDIRVDTTVKSPAFREYEPTLPGALNALAETLENLPVEVASPRRTRGH